MAAADLDARGARCVDIANPGGSVQGVNLVDATARPDELAQGARVGPGHLVEAIFEVRQLRHAAGIELRGRGTE